MIKSTQPTTTDAGAPVASDEYSLTIGADGPIVLHDHYLIEQMANFNRERIEPARARLLSNIIAHLKDGVSEPILARAIDYWHKVDKDFGERIAHGLKEK